MNKLTKFEYLLRQDFFKNFKISKLLPKKIPNFKKFN